MKLVNNDKEQVRVEVKKRNQQRKLGIAGSVRLPPLFVYGDDDCATVYELLLNTYGLSVGLEETKASKSGSESVALDVPLLLCRSLGPCMNTTSRSVVVIEPNSNKRFKHTEGHKLHCKGYPRATRSNSALCNS